MYRNTNSKNIPTVNEENILHDGVIVRPDENKP